MRTRARCLIAGVVQGIGFRPFLFRLARREGLTGLVRNTAAGVTVEVQGEPARVSAFLASLRDETPPHARILSLLVEDREPLADEREFRILPSEGEGGRSALVPPDLAVCEDCRREMRDPADRRFRYPFLNCTQCGPRYTIVRGVPYDRSATSMADFTMCDACRTEYEDPADRRHHAEPTACPTCGPKLRLTTPDGTRVHDENPLEAARRALRAGLIVAIQGLGGFHLAVNARDGLAVDRLRRHKRREEKPLAVMVRDLDQAHDLVEISPEEEALLLSPERPIVLLRRRPEAVLADAVAPHHTELGVLLPYTPLHHLLLDEPASPLVMTSGNLSDEPIARTETEARDRLGTIVDMFLTHDRAIVARADDSVVRHVAGEPRLIRRSRGFVPAPILTERDLGRILAVGADLKSVLAVTHGRRVHLSPHIGDLDDARTLEFFEEVAERMLTLLDVEPEAIAHDLHPDYRSTRWATTRGGLVLLAVQHHHAHVAAVMAEHDLEGEVLGVAWDGTGYGEDGTIWGGEWLVASEATFRRAAHLSAVPLPGGDAAIREPWRAALAHLHAAGFPTDRCAGAREVGPVLDMIESGTNAPLTSSMGRLFDAVASLAGIRDTVSYEGQAAMLLEAASLDGGEDHYPVEIEAGDGPLVLAAAPIVGGVLADLEAGVERGVIGGRFHRTLGRAIVEVCRRLREETGLDRVALSGGCFQNRRLLVRASRGLRDAGFSVYSASAAPVGDGGIALGQAYVAAARRRDS